MFGLALRTVWMIKFTDLFPYISDLIQNSEGFTRYEKVWIGLNDIAVNDEYVWIDGISSSVTYRSVVSNVTDNDREMIEKELWSAALKIVQDAPLFFEFEKSRP